MNYYTEKTIPFLDWASRLSAGGFSIFVLVELAWDNAGKRTGSSNHEKPHNLSAGQVRSGPVSAPGVAVMSRLQFTTGWYQGM